MRLPTTLEVAFRADGKVVVGGAWAAEIAVRPNRPGELCEAVATEERRRFLEGIFCASIVSHGFRGGG